MLSCFVILETDGPGIFIHKKKKKTQLQSRHILIAQFNEFYQEINKGWSASCYILSIRSRSKHLLQDNAIYLSKDIQYIVVKKEI